MYISKRIVLLLALALAFVLVFASEYVNAQATLQEENPSTQQQDAENKERAEGDSEGAGSPENVEPLDEDAEVEDSDETSVATAGKANKPRRRGPRSYSKRSKSFLSAFSPVVSSTSSAIVKVMDGKERIALGVVIDASEGLVLTKASELRGDLKLEFADGTEFEPTVFGVDPETDLVLLKVEKKDAGEAVIEDVFAPEVGSWLATVSQKNVPLAVGIVSHESRQIQSPNSAIIGIQPLDRIDGEGVRINGVSSDSPAEEADLLVNDVITEIDDQDVKNTEQLLEILSNYYPGDEINLKILRDGKEFDVMITLGKRGVRDMGENERDRGVQQNRMGSKLSKRRNKFSLALQHDTALDANDCGGPVVDLSGRIVGINIARSGRVSSLALPAEVVVPAIARLKTGEMLPAVVNKKEIVSVEKELTQMETDLKNLPKEKMEKELQFSAGTAVEDEIQMQIEDLEKRLEELQTRLEKKRNGNIELGKNLASLKSRQSRIEREIDPLRSKLNRLKTGVE